MDGRHRFVLSSLGRLAITPQMRRNLYRFADGYLAEKPERCCTTSIRQPVQQRAVPAADGRSRHRLLDEPLRQCLGQSAMESFFSSLKTERTARKTYRTREEAKADVFDYIERFYNAKRRHSTIGYRSPMEFEMQAGLA